MPSDPHVPKAHGKRPAVALYHRAPACAMLCFHAGDARDHLNPESTFIALHVLQEDDDSACWALEQIKGMAKHENAARLLQLLQHYQSTVRSEDSQAAYMDVIVGTAIADSHLLDSLKPRGLLLAIDFANPVTRQLMISQFTHLLASLHPHHLRTADIQCSVSEPHPRARL